MFAYPSPMADKPEREGWATEAERRLIRRRTVFSDALVTVERRSDAKNYAFKLVQQRYTPEEDAALLRYMVKRFIASLHPKAVYLWGKSVESLPSASFFVVVLFLC